MSTQVASIGMRVSAFECSMLIATASSKLETMPFRILRTKLYVKVDSAWKYCATQVVFESGIDGD